LRELKGLCLGVELLKDGKKVELAEDKEKSVHVAKKV